MEKKYYSFIVPVLLGLIIALAYLQFQTIARQPPLDSHPSHSYASAVERSLASVVSISSAEIAPDDNQAIWNNPVFSGLEDKLSTPPSRPVPRLGSGVIIDKQGHVLTNYHVIRRTEEINVTLASGESQMAKVVGADPDVDLAVVKLARPTQMPIAMATQQPLVGDVVLAIGNSFGVGQSVTQGIISGLGRTNLGLANIENFIQTDVAINPGNSGGALVNTRGELVGVVTAVFSTDGAYQGISFAIPAYSAIDIAKNLILNGKIERGYLGVEMHKLTTTEADFFGLGGTNGMLVTGVHPGSPAQQAGIELGDVLLAINGKALRTLEQGQQAVSTTKPGSTISISLYRKGQVVDLQATLTSR